MLRSLPHNNLDYGVTQENKKPLTNVRGYNRGGNKP